MRVGGEITCDTPCGCGWVQGMFGWRVGVRVCGCVWECVGVCVGGVNVVVVGVDVCTAAGSSTDP